jgi:hypothetical protein
MTGVNSVNCLGTPLTVEVGNQQPRPIRNDWRGSETTNGQPNDKKSKVMRFARKQNTQKDLSDDIVRTAQ